MAPFFEGLSQNTTLKELSLKSITGKEEDPGIVDWDSVVCRGLPINLTTLSVKLVSLLHIENGNNVIYLRQ